jgi:hypothetical protein
LLAPLVHSFRIVPDHFRKKFFRNKLISATSPPPPPQIFGQCTILGVKKIFRNNKMPKLPYFFANIARLPLFEQQTADFYAFLLFYGPILPDFYANIARLPLFEQQTADFYAFTLFYFPLYKHVRIFFRKNRQYFR